MKIVYYVAASLDGFIADINEGVAWLDKLNIDQQATGYDAFFSTVDGLLMGRKTYDFIFNYGQWPYENKPTWVCSNRPVPPMEGCNLQPEQRPETAIQQARHQGLATLWVVGGGRLVGELINARRLTHVSVSLMPILLGDGIPLVHALPSPVFLQQESAQSLSGFTQVEYRVGSSIDLPH